jgi:hypothetical protein
MIGSRDNSNDPLENLIDALIEDTLAESSDELRERASHRFGSLDKAVARIDSLIASAIEGQGKSRLSLARKEYDKRSADSSEKTVIMPFKDKLALLKQVITANDQLTLAARSGDDDTTENDVDTMLRDFIALGLIDEEGNLL